MLKPERLSPSCRIFNAFCQDITPTKDEINGLIGKEVLDLDSHPGYGIVKRVRGNTVYYKPFIRGKQQSVVARYLTPTSNTGYLVHGREPDAIWFRPRSHWYPDAKFVLDDPELNEILTPALEEFPKVETTRDIRRLTVWILRNVRHRPSWVDPTQDHGKSLGQAVKDIGAVCRHYAAIEYSILRLRDVEAYHVASDAGKFKSTTQDGTTYTEEHAFVEVYPKDGPMLIVDPTSHLVLPLDEVLEEFKGSEKITAFYTTYQRVTPEGKWVSRTA